MTPTDDSSILETPSSEPSRTNSPVPPRRKKAKVDMVIEEDKFLVKSLKEIQETACERRAQKEDMDTNFALEVAGRLKRLSPRQNAYMKLQIQQLLFNVEFPQDTDVPIYQNTYHQY